MSGLPRAEVAIDLGTAFTRVSVLGQAALAVDEPTLVRVRADVGLAEAVGRQALDPETPGELRAALRGGVIADLDVAVMLLRKLLWRLRRSPLVRLSLLLGVPSDASEAESAMLAEAGRLAGASSVRLVPEPLAAAIGGGLDLGSPYAQLVADVGEGVTDVGLVHSGRLAGAWTVRAGCAALRQSVTEAVARERGLVLASSEAGRALAEALAAGNGDVCFLARDRPDAAERRIDVPRRALAEAAEPALATIAGTLRRAWSDLTPQSSCQVIESGVLLVGGGALLPRIPERLAAETGLEVHVAGDPLHAVIAGVATLAGHRTPA